MRSGTSIGVPLDTVRALQGFQLLRQGASILLAILLAKSGLSLEGIGLYEMLMYIGTTLSFFWINGSVQGLLTLYPNQSRDRQRDLIFTAYLTFLAMSLATGLLLLLGRHWIQQLLAGGASLDHYLLFAAYLMLNWPTYLLENFLQLDKRPLGILAFGLLAFGGQLGVVLVPLYLGFGLQASIIGLLGLGATKHLLLLVYVLRRGRPGFDAEQFREWLWLALPLGAYALVGGFSQAFDGWLVNWHFKGDESAFATWRYGARELPLSLALVSGLATGLLPGLAEDLQSGLAEVRQRSLRIQHFLFPLALLLLASSHWWFPRVFNPDFSDSIPVFNLFVLILVSRVVFSRTVLMGLKDNRVVLYVSLVELALNVGLSWLLVPRLGLSGIAIGTVVAYTFEKLAHALWLYFQHRIPPARYAHLGWLAFYACLLMGVFAWTLWRT